MQIDHMSTEPKGNTVFSTHCRTAAGGKHHTIDIAKVCDHRLLTLTKSLLAFNIKDPRNICARTLLNLFIRVFERQPQLFSKQTPDGAFTSPHRANKDQIPH